MRLHCVRGVGTGDAIASPLWTFCPHSIDMTNRVYDSSFLTMRKAEKAVANSFLSPYGTQSMRGSLPLLGIKDSSIMYAVKTGGMTEYKRFDTCYGIDVGCPCAATNKSVIDGNPALPGYVSGIVFTVGSIIVSWQLPTTGLAPFSYVVTPYLNGVALPSVTTSALTYRFVGLQEGMPYTFTVCAMNGAGQGPALTSSAFLAPPENLSLILQGSTVPVDVAPSMTYILNAGLNDVMSYAASINMGPTVASRLAYVWVASVTQAWNWATAESHITGTHDGWNWSSKAGTPLSDCDAIIWISSIIDYVTPILVPVAYRSIYTYSAADVTRVKAAGNWDSWSSAWSAWYTLRQADGAAAAITTMPTATATATMPISATPLSGAANWDNTIVVDGTTVTPIASFPHPQDWTRLTIRTGAGAPVQQKYLTWLWDTVSSTCLTAANEQEMAATVAPVTGAARDAEIDDMMAIVASLTDAQKVQAELWAGSSIGSVSPPHMFIWLWKEYMRSTGFNCNTVMYSLMDLAIHIFEIGRVVWGIKAQWMQDRPIQEIRRRYAGQPVASWNSAAIDGAQWTPYQRANFVTPPFPDFVSGHSGFSKVFALTMAKWFGPNITKTQTMYDNLPLFAPVFSTQIAQQAYGDFIVNAGASLVQPTIAPAAPVTVSFSAWDDMATSAGMSRLYGGIHTIAAHTASQTVAAEVDGFIGTSWGISTSPL